MTWRSELLQRLQEVRGNRKTRNQLYITGSLLFTVPLTPTFYWEEGILYGGGSVVVSGSSFNEDTNGGDELIAEVLLQDCTEFQRFGCYPIRGFYSGFIYGSW